MGRRNQKGRKGGKREWKRARWRPGSARGLTQTIGQPKAKPRSTGTGRLPPFLLLLPVPSVASLPSRCCASVNDKKINKPAVGAEDPKDAAPEWSRCCADFPTGKMGPGIGTSLGYFPWVDLGPCLFFFILPLSCPCITRDVPTGMILIIFLRHEPRRGRGERERGEGRGGGKGNKRESRC